MEKRRSRRRKLVVLAMAGMVFLFHYLGLLPALVLTVSGLAVILVVLGLVVEVHVVKKLLRKLLKSMERRLSTCEETES